MSKPRTHHPKHQGVLVVGDWVVDDHWVVGEHRSASSSRTGLRHSRALHDDNCSVRSLCGAGQVATILHQAQFDPPVDLQVFGLGLWHPNDGEQLALMLDPDNNVGNTPYQLSRPAQDSSRGGLLGSERMFNLASTIPEEGRGNQQVGTTRVIRIYEQIGGSLQLTRRVDWEPSLSGATRAHLIGAAKGLELPNWISRIVVKDLRKGVVTPELIRHLTAHYPDATWYVSSKAWRPDWLKEVPKEKVRVLCVPQLAAASAVRSDDVKVSAWITSSGEVSYDALKEMDALAKEFTKALIAVLPAEMTVIARAPSQRPAGALPVPSRPDKEAAGWLISDDMPAGPGRFVPMASVFFPALVAAQLQDEAGEPGVHLQVAFHRTKRWMELEALRFVQRDWKPPPAQRLRFSPTAEPPPLYLKTYRPFEWDAVKRDWEASFKISDNNELVGVRQVTNGGSWAFEIWRAMTEVPGYVCSIRAKRKVLQILLDQGRSFGSRGRRQHKSFVLVDSPGSGKSFLIKQYQKAIGARLLEFNVTQLLGRGDLLHCFDTIVTSHAQDPDAHWLVFFDEINAKLDGQHVYDAFLTPLEDGYYVREGNKFLIEPCLWVFAGTERPDAPGGPLGGSDKSDKGGDFESRLTLPVFDLRVNTTDEKAQTSAMIERVYTGVAVIQAMFRDVRYVSKAVLKALKMLPTNATPRDIRRLVKRIEYVQHGKVTAENLPEKWFDLFPPAKDGVNNKEDLRRRWAKILEDPDSKELVEIRVSP
jgi:hypothetical protein